MNKNIRIVKTEKQYKPSILLFIKAMVFSIAITLVIFSMFSLFLVYTSFPEDYIYPAIITTMIISIILTSASLTVNHRTRGWLNGGVVGLLYIILIYIISGVAFGDFSISYRTLSLMAIGTITGIVGGIIGINLKWKIRKK